MGTTAVVGAFGLGAGLMFLLDPLGGPRRRAVTRQRLVRLVRLSALQGRRLAGRRRPPDDNTVEARVRHALDRTCRHPRALHVLAAGGTVRLWGPVLEEERDRVLTAVRRVKGVTHVEDGLVSHHDPRTAPTMHRTSGLIANAGRHLVHHHWNTLGRAVAGALGATLVAVGLRRRDLAGAGLATVGATLLVRSALNRTLRQITGVGAGRRAVDVRRTVRVAAPLDEVFSLWSDLESFPRFMSHVREVRRSPTGHYHWVVEGPMGRRFEWDAELTRSIPGRLIGWKSTPGSTVEGAGVVRFRRTRDGTLVDVRLSYNPPAGAIGHGIAALLGANPKRQIEEDLNRFKRLAEQRRTPSPTA